MKYFKEINGKQVFFDGKLKVGDKQIINPTKDELLADGWLEYVAPSAKPYVTKYEERVEQLIRERYSVSDELAILRQRDTKPSEFEEYFAFSEECKAIAKNEFD